MIFIPNCHWNYTKFKFSVIPVVIWYEYHTSVFAVYRGSGGMPPGKIFKVHVLKLHFRALSVDVWQAQSSSVLKDFTVAMHV